MVKKMKKVFLKDENFQIWKHRYSQHVSFEMFNNFYI